MRKKRTPLQNEFSLSRRKLKRKIRDIGKRGYEFTGNIPERATRKNIEKILEYIKNIYEYTKYTVDDRSISGVERRREERSKAAKKGFITRAANKTRKEYERLYEDRIHKNYEEEYANQSIEILNSVREAIDTFAPNSHWTDMYAERKNELNKRLHRYLNDAIARDGIAVVARRLENSAEDIVSLVNEIQYGSGEEKMELRLAHFASIVLGRAFTLAESIEYSDEEGGEEY